MVSLYFFLKIIFRFGVEGWIWVLISSVPCLCIRFTFLQFARNIDCGNTLEPRF